MKNILLSTIITGFFLVISGYTIGDSPNKTYIETCNDTYASRENTMTKLISDSFGNLYTTYRVKSHGWEQVWVYQSVDNGGSWMPLGKWGPIQIMDYSQRPGALAIDSKNRIYCVWYGLDADNTNEYYDSTTLTWKAGEYQIKFSYYEKGKWADWKNVSEVRGFYSWVHSREPGFYKGWQQDPSIAVDSKDNIFLAWHGADEDHDSVQIKFSRSTDRGETFTAWKNITDVMSENNTNFNQYNPVLIVGENDRLWLIWYGEASDQQVTSTGSWYTDLYHLYSDDLGETWSYGGSSSRFASSASKSQRYVSGIYNPNDGKVHIVFRGREDKVVKDYIKYSYFDTNLNMWITWPKPVGNVDTIYELHNPVITYDRDNNIHVMWDGNDAEHPIYDDLDPGSKDLEVGCYIYHSVLSNGMFAFPTNWTKPRIIDKGTTPQLLTSKYGHNITFTYSYPNGYDDFILFSDSLTDYQYSGAPEPIYYRGEESVYLSPNPFNPYFGDRAVIQYELLQDSAVSLSIHDMFGKNIVHLVNDENTVRSSGVHQFFWDGSIGNYVGEDNMLIGDGGSRILPGIYYLQLNTDKGKVKQRLFVQYGESDDNKDR